VAAAKKAKKEAKEEKLSKLHLSEELRMLVEANQLHKPQDKPPTISK